MAIHYDPFLVFAQDVFGVLSESAPLSAKQIAKIIRRRDGGAPNINAVNKALMMLGASVTKSQGGGWLRCPGSSFPTS